ncbi:hypothetical protein LCGC14_0823350 [marine sediment metagenome]|uniref:DUF1737 domain-containing protein n=1 Tax=marine sediment metagenome TaxID=412755 RepID=A0A0F9S306_9ZZZZ|nr:DUF1737 domain-containing protein [Candidatus Scalindua sp.]
MDYTIINKNDIDKLTKEVNMLMCAGWKPIGGVSCTVSTKRLEPNTYYYRQYVQALIKE